MTHVSGMAAVKVSNPIGKLVLVKTDDASFHLGQLLYRIDYQVRREDLLFAVPVLERLFHLVSTDAIACEEASYGRMFDAQQAP